MKRSHFFFCLILLFSALALTGCPKETPPKQAPPQRTPVISETAKTEENKITPTIPILPSEKDLKAPSEVIEIGNLKQFLKILDDNPLVVVDFNATWCGPCRFIMPKLENWSVEYKKDGIKFLSVDVDKNSNIARAYNVDSIPDLRFIVNGKVISQVIGADVRKIQRELHEIQKRKSTSSNDSKTSSASAKPQGDESHQGDLKEKK